MQQQESLTRLVGSLAKGGCIVSEWSIIATASPARCGRGLEYARASSIALNHLSLAHILTSSGVHFVPSEGESSVSAAKPQAI